MKEREFINPFTDFGFKRIFGQEINKLTCITKAMTERSLSWRCRRPDRITFWTEVCIIKAVLSLLKEKKAKIGVTISSRSTESSLWTSRYPDVLDYVLMSL